MRKSVLQALLIWVGWTLNGSSQIITNNGMIEATNHSLYSAYTVLNATTNAAFFHIRDASTALVAHTFSVGYGTSRTGILSVSEGGLLMSSNIVIGHSGQGYASISNSTLSCLLHQTIASNAGSYGSLLLDTSSNSIHQNLYIGCAGTSTGVLMLAHGSWLRQYNTEIYSWNPWWAVSIGVAGKGTLTATNSTLQVAGGEYIATGAGGRGELILDSTTNWPALHVRCAIGGNSSGSIFMANQSLTRNTRRTIFSDIAWRTYDVWFTVGEWGKGTLSASQSAIDWAGAFHVGVYSNSLGSATFDQSSLSVGSGIYLGYRTWSTGTLSMSQSVLHQFSNGTSCALDNYVTSGVYVGYSGRGTLEASQSLLRITAGAFIGYTNRAEGRLTLVTSTNTFLQDFRVGHYGGSTGWVALAAGSLLLSTNPLADLSLGTYPGASGALELSDSILNLKGGLSLGGLRSNPGGQASLCISNHSSLMVGSTAWVHQASSIRATDWELIQFSNRVELLSGAQFVASAPVGSNSVLQFQQGLCSTGSLFQMSGGCFQLAPNKTSEFVRPLSAVFSNVTFGAGFIINVYTGAGGYVQDADPRGTSVVYGADNIRGAELVNPLYAASVTNYFQGLVGWFGVSGIVGHATYTTPLDLNAYAYPGNTFTLSNGVLNVGTNLLTVGSSQTLLGIEGGDGATFANQDVLNAGAWILVGAGVRAEIAGSMQNYGALQVANRAAFIKTGTAVTNNGSIFITNSAAFSDNEVIIASESNAWFYMDGTSTALVANTFSIGQAAGFTGTVEVSGGSLLAVTNGSSAQLLVGNAGTGWMAISNATLEVSGSEFIGQAPASYGRLTIASGTNTTRFLQIAARPGSTGDMQLADGGVVITSNGVIRIGTAGSLGLSKLSRLHLIDGNLFLSNNAAFTVDHATFLLHGQVTSQWDRIRLLTNAIVQFADAPGLPARHIITTDFKPRVQGDATVHFSNVTWSAANVYLATNAGAALAMNFANATGTFSVWSMGSANATSRVFASQSRFDGSSSLSLGAANGVAEMTISNSYFSSAANMNVGSGGYGKLSLINSTNISGWRFWIGNGGSGVVQVLQNSSFSCPDGNYSVIGVNNYGQILASNSTLNLKSIIMGEYWGGGGIGVLEAWNSTITMDGYLSAAYGPSHARCVLNDGSRLSLTGSQANLLLAANMWSGARRGSLHATNSLIDVQGTITAGEGATGHGEITLTHSTNMAAGLTFGVLGTGSMSLAEGSYLWQTAAVRGVSLAQGNSAVGRIFLSNSTAQIAGWLSVGGITNTAGGIGWLSVSNGASVNVAGMAWVHSRGVLQQEYSSALFSQDLHLHGTWISRASTSTVLRDLWLQTSAQVRAKSDSRIKIGGSFIHTATNRAGIDMTNLTLRFEGASGTMHTQWVAGTDYGRMWMGSTTNFVLGGLELTAGEEMVLHDADGNGTGAVYVIGAVLFEGGIDQITNAVAGNGLNLYYHADVPANAYLQSKRYIWKDNVVGRGGGELIPLSNQAPEQVVLHSPTNCPDEGPVGPAGDVFDRYGRVLNPRARLVWHTPMDADGDALHFRVHYDLTNGTRLAADSSTNATNFAYWDEAAWQAFPASGLASTNPNWRVSFQPAGDYSTGSTSIFWTVAALDGIVTGAYSSVWRFDRCERAWTDPALQGLHTRIRDDHILELRQEANYLHVCRTLATNAWTDPVLTPGQTRIRAVHMEEMRSALGSLTNVTGETLPGWTDEPITANQTPIKTNHIWELRKGLEGW